MHKELNGPMGGRRYQESAASLQNEYGVLSSLLTEKERFFRRDSECNGIRMDMTLAMRK